MNVIYLKWFQNSKNSEEYVFEKVCDSLVSGLDNVCTKLIKYGSKAVAPILCKIFKMCLKQGWVPDELKVVRVNPIYKSGSKDDLSNYRPISILPICSKILEKIVHKQLYKYVIDNNLTYTMVNQVFVNSIQLPLPLLKPLTSGIWRLTRETILVLYFLT